MTEVLFQTELNIINDWMRGQHTSEEINQIVAKKTGIPYEVLWKTFVKDCRSMYIEPELLELIQELRNYFHTVLITGNMDCFTRFTVPALSLTGHFDAIVNSFDEGQLKSDRGGESFKNHCRGDLQKAVLVDDSPRTCEVFKTLGGTAYQVTATTPAKLQLQNILACV